jgi:hypothetical protein
MMGNLGMQFRKSCLFYANCFIFAIGMTHMEAVDRLDKEAAAPPAAEEYPKVEYTSSQMGIRDPFESYIIRQQAQPGTQVPQYVSVSLPSMSVQGMVWGGKYGQAIINNQVVKVGESINGAELVSVSKDGIKLLYQGQTFILAPANPIIPPEK